MRPSSAHRANIQYAQWSVEACTTHPHRPVLPLIKLSFRLISVCKRSPPTSSIRSRSLHPPWRAPPGPARPIWDRSTVSLLNHETRSMWSLVRRKLCDRPLFDGYYASCPLKWIFLPLPDMLRLPPSGILFAIPERPSLTPCQQTGTGGLQSTSPHLSSSACACKNYRRSCASEFSWLPFFVLHHRWTEHCSYWNGLSEECGWMNQKWHPCASISFFFRIEPFRWAFLKLTLSRTYHKSTVSLYDSCWKVFQQWLRERPPAKIGKGFVFSSLRFRPYMQPQPSHCLCASQMRYTFPFVHAFYIIKEDDKFSFFALALIQHYSPKQRIIPHWNLTIVLPMFACSDIIFYLFCQPQYTIPHEFGHWDLSLQAGGSF